MRDWQDRAIAEMLGDVDDAPRHSGDTATAGMMETFLAAEILFGLPLPSAARCARSV
jgi:hypothetical protein